MIMHSYLRAVGFSEIKDRKELEKILSMIMDEPTDKKTYKINDHKTVTEISKDFSKHIGITIRGEYDDNGTFHLGHYFPYVKSQYLSTNEGNISNKESGYRRLYSNV